MPIPIRPQSPILMIRVMPKPNPSVYEQAQYTDVILLIGLQYQRLKLFLSSKLIPFGFINANLAVAFAFYFDVINACPASGLPIENLFLRVYFDQHTAMSDFPQFSIVPFCWATMPLTRHITKSFTFVLLQDANA